MATPPDPIDVREIEDHERETKRLLVPFAVMIVVLAAAFLVILRHPYW